MTTPEQFKLFLNGATIMTTPTADLLRIARSAGFVGVEVRAERLLDLPDEVHEAEEEVRPGEVWSLNGLQLKVDRMGQFDRELALHELDPRLEICRRLGAGHLLIVPPRMRGLETNAAVTAMQSGLALVSERAWKVGVRVAFEFLGFDDCPINTASLAARVVAPLENVDLVLDSCHWHAAGGETLAAFPVDRLAMVHVNDAPAIPPRTIEDADRVLPGQGVIRLAHLVDQLDQAGYRGPFSLETFNPEFWAMDAHDVARRGQLALSNLLTHPRA